MVRVSELSAAQVVALRSTQASALAKLTSPTTNRAATKAAFVRMYKRAGRSAPEVQWFASVSKMQYAMTGRPISLIDTLHRQLDIEFGYQVISSQLKGRLIQALRMSFETIVGAIPPLYAQVYAFGRDELGVEYSKEFSQGLDDWLTAIYGCWQYALYEDKVMCVERPKGVHVELDRRRAADYAYGVHAWQLHRLDGPAVEFQDGSGTYVIHGTFVDKGWFDRRHQFRAQDWYYGGEAAARRVLAELIGWEKLVRSEYATKVASDRWGTLWSMRDYDGDEPIVVVEVLNSTPEPDGTTQTFFLRVDPRLRPMRADGAFGLPQIRTPLNAIASTFGMTGEEYEHIHVMA